MPRLASIAPVFSVADVDATIRWYEEHLGCVSFPFPPSPPHVFAIVSRDDIEIMFQRIDAYLKPEIYNSRSGGVWDAYFRMSGVRDFYEAIRNEVEIKQLLRQQPYGAWEFEVKDPNGYILVFSEMAE